MNAPMVAPQSAPAPRGIPAAPALSDPATSRYATAGWRIVGWTGVLFVLAGGVDLALVWYPPAFGSPEWEFGTVTALMSGLPVFLLGLALQIAAAVAQRQRTLVRVLAGVLLLAAVGILAAAGVWATTVPIALKSVPADTMVLLGIQKAIARTAMQAVIYPTMLLVIATIGWRAARRQ